MTDKTYFGFKQVEIEEKSKLVKGVFDSVAQNYDVMNDVMSLGIHHLWKAKLLEQITAFDKKLLDVAGGTGDIAKRYRSRQLQQNFDQPIIIYDINIEMLKVGRDKMFDSNVISGVQYICGDAEKLPFSDMSFDYYTIAFGIRNVTNINNALSEAYRVLKPGGKFLCLEFSHPISRSLESLYNFYSFNIIPFMGQLIAKNKDAYQYLIESIRKFPSQNQFLRMIQDQGFTKVNYLNLTGGIAAIHYGYRT